MREEVEAWRQQRQINYLLHFTRLENVESILQHGLLPRMDIDAGAIACVANDDLRLDGRPNFNCLSIAFPNAPMFFRFQKDNPEVSWAILVINPVVMAVKHTLFCRHNAANGDISATAECDLTTIQAFQGMFDELEGLPSRQEQRLKPQDPTDVQAEVLIEGVIEPEFIMAVVFRNANDHAANVNHLGDRKGHIHTRRGFFGTRGYFRQFGAGA